MIITIIWLYETWSYVIIIIMIIRQPSSPLYQSTVHKVSQNSYHYHYHDDDDNDGDDNDCNDDVWKDNDNSLMTISVYPQWRRSAKHSQHYGCRKPDAKVYTWWSLLQELLWNNCTAKHLKAQKWKLYKIFFHHWTISIENSTSTEKDNCNFKAQNKDNYQAQR